MIRNFSVNSHKSFKNQTSLHFKSKLLSIRSFCRENRKVFTQNGAITTSDIARYFYVDPRPTNEKILLPRIRQGDYIMLYGARGSGKTTRAFAAEKQLENEFCCLSTSFQTGVDFRDLDKFWTSFSESLISTNRHINIPFFSSSSGFQKLFRLENKELLFLGKQVVVFIDEFDKLYRIAPDEVTNSILDTLRGIKQQKKSFCVQSVVSIGPFNILEITGQSSSSFNVADAVKSPHFSKEQVIQLFKQFSDNRCLDLDERIPLDIYYRTRGYVFPKFLLELRQTFWSCFIMWKAS
eukprot:TRINITY_DN9941_c0_g4_i4.p2 TRINITY_DN9941_c0_g4~~TRINITY_DN9941_c0_g4_i4.p2  ORF type:complete len:294 (+),score=32.24 TRINITY_DN9941_c0_g4_i4:29-910(+)